MKCYIAWMKFNCLDVTISVLQDMRKYDLLTCQNELFKHISVEQMPSFFALLF
jgi:hypothetical protein